MPDVRGGGVNYYDALSKVWMSRREHCRSAYSRDKGRRQSPAHSASRKWGQRKRKMVGCFDFHLRKIRKSTLYQTANYGIRAAAEISLVACL